MLNLTDEIKHLHAQNDFDEKTMDSAKRQMVILQDKYNFDVKMRDKKELELNSSIFGELGSIKKQIGQLNNETENETDILTPKDFTELALTSFEMKFYSSAIKFLTEGIRRLGKIGE